MAGFELKNEIQKKVIYELASSMTKATGCPFIKGETVRKKESKLNDESDAHAVGELATVEGALYDLTQDVKLILVHFLTDEEEAYTLISEDKLEKI